MKKKGFTLVELLAIIVILAIVALITVPTVLGVIEKTKKGALKDSAYGLIESANIYYAQYGVSKTARFDIENGIQNTEEENELSYKGNIKNGTVLINNKGKIMVCVNEDGYSAYKNYSQNEVIAVNKETCYIPENNSMVYLEQSGKTLSELTNQELTEEMNVLKGELNILKNKVISLEDENNAIKNTATSIDKVYPVGSIYITLSDVNPSTLFSGTTWERYGQGKTLVGDDESSYITGDEIKGSGGSSTVTLTTSNLPSHSHNIPSLNGLTSNTGSGYGWSHACDWRGTTESGYHAHSAYFDIYGSNYLMGAFLNSTTPGANPGFAYNSDLTLGERNGTLDVTATGNHTHNSLDCYLDNIWGLENHNHTVTTTSSTTGNTGLGTSFSVQNPYTVVYMWKRVS